MGGDSNTPASVLALIQKLGSQGIQLWLENSEKTGEPELKFKAPKGALTPSLRGELVANKAEVIAFLRDVRVGGQASEQTIPVLDRQGRTEFPLSFSQQRLWFIDQFEPNSSTYNIPIALYLKGELDVEALRLSIQAIVQRHEVLRTVFKSVDGEAVQVVLADSGFDNQKPGEWQLPMHDLSLLDEGEREAKALKHAQLEIESPFDLVTGPLLRTRLIKLSEHRYALLATLHHIVADGGSLEVLVQELAQFYRHFKLIPSNSTASPVSPAVAEIPALPIQYVDYAVWQRDWLQGEELGKQLAYWQQHLLGAPPLLTLPTDRPRPRIQTQVGAHLPIVLDENLVEQLRQLSRQQGATLYMTLMAGFKLLLSRYSQQQDITVGMPIAGRNRQELEPLIGFFVNSLVTRTRFDDNPTVADLIQRERTSILGAHAHQDVPFEAVVEVLDVERDMSYAPVRQVAFSLTESVDSSQQPILAGIELEPMDVELTTAKVDLSLLLQDSGRSEVEGSFEYNTDLFDENSIEEMALHYKRILTCFVSDSAQSIDAICLHDDTELRVLLKLDDECGALQPLTAMQRDFYFLSETQQSTLACSLGYAIHLHHRIDESLWRQALKIVSDRNDVLRIKFVKSRHPTLEPVYQVVQKSIEVNFTTINLTHLHTEDEDNPDLQKEIEGFICHPYCLDQDPLVSYALIKLSDTHYVPLLACHHGVLDGMSESQHLRQLLSVYESLVATGSKPIEGSPSFPQNPFFNFVPQIRAKTDTAEVNAFWAEKLKGVEPLAVSLGSGSDSGSGSGKPKQKRLCLESRHAEKIEQYCQQQSISKANYFKCLFSLLVSEYHRASGDFIIGEVVAGRRVHLQGSKLQDRNLQDSNLNESDKFDVALGCFIQVIPFVVNYQMQSAGASIADYFKASRQTRQTLGNNQYLSLHRQSQLTPTPVLQFQVNYRLASATSSFSFMGKEAEIQFVTPEGPNVVKLVTTESSEGIALGLHYHDGQFDELSLLQRLESISEQVLNGVSEMRDLNFLLPQEENELVQLGVGPSKPFSQESVAQLLSKVASQFPEQVAVVFSEQSLTYDQLEKRSNQMARFLVSQGAGPEVMIGLCVERSIDMIVAMLAIVKSGSAFLPLDVAYPKERLAYMLEESKASLLLTESPLLAQLPQHSAKLFLLDQFVEQAHDQLDTALGFLSAATDAAYVIYTSGSTGQPKGVVAEHGNLQHYIHSALDLYEITSKDVVLQFSSISFDASIEEIFPALCVGARLVLRDETLLGDADSFFTATQIYGITVLSLPTAYWQELVGQLSKAICPLLESLRLMIIGGERVHHSSVALWQKWIGNHVKLMNTYGPTETTVVATAADLTDFKLTDFNSPSSPIPIGKAIANVTCAIVNPQGKPVPAGIAGELVVGGAGVTRGYLGKEELTHGVFSFAQHQTGDQNAKVYRTGDLVRYVAKGLIEYVGRIDKQVKIRGYRVELGEIESVLSKVDGVHDCIVLAVDGLNQSQAKRLVGFVVLKSHIGLKSHAGISSKPHRSRDEESMRLIKASLKAGLPDYMVPSGFVILEAIPKTLNGKTDRASLTKKSHLMDVGTEYVAPHTHTEITLENIWKEVLGLKQVSIEDSFFDLGGHSLLATQIISRVRTRFQIELPLRKIFEAPTIVGMSKAIGIAIEMGLADVAPKITALGSDTKITVSFAQHRLWFIDQLHPDQTAYNIPTALRIKGELRVDIVTRVFEEIVNRHEVLRTRFIDYDDDCAKENEQENADKGDLELVKLVVQAPRKWDLPVVDLSELSLPEQSHEIQRYVEEDADTPFDLRRDLLLRTRLLKLSGSEFVLLFCMHHIASDGWSLGLVIKEIRLLYQAFKESRPSPLDPLPIQYRDFAHWQRQWLSGDVLQNQLNYWLAQLRGAPEVLRLPTDRPRPAQQSFNGAHHAIRFDPNFSAEIVQFCQRNAMTPFILLLTAFQLLLSRYCSQDDVCVGVPIAGRNRDEIENLIGFFINGLVIRTDVSGNPTVTQLLEQVRETTIGAFSHQDIPADLLIDALQVERSQTFSPGAQVGFAWQNTPQEKLGGQIDDLIVEVVGREHKTSKYEISLILAEDAKGIGGVLEYNTDLFLPSTIERFATQYQRVLYSMISAPDALIDNIPVANEEELRGILDVTQDCEIRRLTTKQRDIYLDSLVSKSYGQNCMGYCVELKTDNMRMDLWQQAEAHVAASQSLMRTRLVESDVPYTDVAYQVVDASVKAEMDYLDCSHLQLNDEQIHQLVLQRIQRPWKIDGALVSYQFLKTAENVYWGVFSAHHILMDGVSFSTHGKSMIEAYTRLCQNEECPTYSDVFADYITENREKFDTFEVLEYWRERFNNIVALDFPLPSRQLKEDDQGEINHEVEHVLEIQLWQEIKQYCKQNRSSPALFLKSIYGLLINNYCGAESDFVVTEFSAGRSRQNLRALGCYFQSIPFVFEQHLFDGDKSFIEICQYARQFSKQLRTNQFISDLAQKRLHPSSRLHFTYNYYHFLPTIEFEGEYARSRNYDPDLRGPVQLVAALKDEGLYLKLIYLPSLFSDLDFLPRFESLVKQILSGVERVGDLEFILPQEKVILKQHLLEAEEPRAIETIVDLFEQQVAETPTAIALINGDNSLTYIALNEKVNQLSHYLLNAGMKTGNRVGVCLDYLAEGKGADLLISILAIVKTGAAYIPIDSTLPKERIQYIVNDAQITLLVSHQAIVERFSRDNTEAAKTPILCLDARCPEINKCSIDNPSLTISNLDSIYVIYTSGSTGEPKGVAITHGGVSNLQRWYGRELKLDSSARGLLVSAIGFDLTQKNLFAFILNGGALVIPKTDGYDPESIVEDIKKFQITVINCAPSLFYPLVEMQEEVIEQECFENLSTLRSVILGGEPIQKSRLTTWLSSGDCHSRVMNSYGPTECSDVVAFHWLENEECVEGEESSGVIPIGRAIENTHLRVLDHNLQPVPVGVVGELYVSGDGVGLGYINKKTLTNNVFIDNPFDSGHLYKTGDRVRCLPTGDLEYIGRRDFQVKLRGLRIELGEVEFALRQLPKITDALVVLKEEKLAGYVLCNEFSRREAFDSSDWRTALQSFLPEYMIPFSVMALETWPLTINGKIDRTALPDPQHSSMSEFVSPRNEIEETLAAIWCEVLGLDKVSIHDGFFALGGHSLLAVKAASQFRKSFQVEIPLRTLFDLHTIAEISEYISASQWAVESVEKSRDDEGLAEGRVEGLL